MRLTVANFLAKATKNEAARWAFWARRAGFRSVGPWLERLAMLEVAERERPYLQPTNKEGPAV